MAVRYITTPSTTTTKKTTTGPTPAQVAANTAKSQAAEKAFLESEFAKSLKKNAPVVTVTENSLSRTDTKPDYPGTPRYVEDKKPTQQMSIVPSSPSIDIEARINALNQAKQALAIANLGKARDTQLSNLTGEESAIKPMYYDKRNATAATNMLGRRTLAEELAARGETKSGVADQANINANMSLQGETGLLNRQESADITDIARRRTGVNNAYESDVVSAKNNLEAVAMQNLIDQYNADRQYKLQEAGLTGNLNGQQTLDALNANRNFSLNEANLTGLYNSNPTLASQAQTFNQNVTTQQLAQAAKQQELDNLYRQQTFDYQKSRDTVSDSQWQKAMNLDLRQQTFAESQQKIENAYQSRQISLDEKNQALQWAKYNADSDPNSLDNQYKQAQIDAMGNKTNTNTTTTIDDYASTINSLYIAKPSVDNGYRSTVDTAGIRAYLSKLAQAGVDDAIINSLGARYGIIQ